MNLGTDALMCEMEDWLDRAATAVRDVLGVAPVGVSSRRARVVRDVAVVVERVDTLVSVPPSAASWWWPDGWSWDVVDVDGVDLALGLVSVVGRARARVGVSRRRDRMPVPCPHCEHDALGRWAGSEVVDCGFCHASWSEQDYRRLTLILAEDYRELM